MLIKGGIFDKIKNENLLLTLSGLIKTIVDDRVHITHIQLRRGEAHHGINLYQTIKDCLLTGPRHMAHAAGIDEESEDNLASTETKLAKVSHEADQIRLASARRGAASSGDRPLSPGIVFRSEGIRTIVAAGLARLKFT